MALDVKAATASPAMVATPYAVFRVMRNSPILDAVALDCAVENTAETPVGRLKYTGMGAFFPLNFSRLLSRLF